MSSFLTSEIDEEKNNAQSIPDIPGFKISPKGSVVKLTRQSGKNTVTVTFNVNGSVDMAADHDMDNDESQEYPKMESRPAFDVEVSREGRPTLAFECHFATDDVGATDEGIPQPAFEISTLSLLKKGETIETESVYQLSGALSDGTLYNLLIAQLAEVGIDEAFADQLCSYATAYEQSLYVKFLEELKEATKD